MPGPRRLVAFLSIGWLAGWAIHYGALAAWPRLQAFVLVGVVPVLVLWGALWVAFGVPGLRAPDPQSARFGNRPPAK